MKKILALLLCLITVATSAVACDGRGTGSTDTTAQGGSDADTEESTTAPDTGEETVLKLITGGVADCRIIVPDGVDAMFELARELADNMREYLGAAPKILADSEAGKVKQNDILLGKTKFSQTGEAERLANRYEDWFCGVIDSAFVLFGNTDRTLKSAVGHLTNKYIYIHRKGSKGDLHFSSLNNRLSVYDYSLQSLTLGGSAITEFSIVYPKTPIAGERYAADELQEFFFDRAGVLIPTVTAGAELPEKRIEFQTRSEGTGFAVRLDGTVLTVTGGDLFDFQDALTYLTEKAFSGKKEIALESGFSYTGTTSSGALSQKTGEYRIMFWNVLGWEATNYSAGTSQNGRDDNAASLVLAYMPDVVGFNEYINLYKNDKSFENALLANGYKKVPLSSPKYTEHSPVPLFYLESRFTYVDGTYIHYNPSSDEISYGATAAVLQDKASGEKLIVVTTHLNSAYGISVEDAIDYRLGNVAQLDAAIRALCNTHGNIPVIIGGDMNNKAKDEGDASVKLESLGYQNLRETAADKNDICSCHGIPVYDELLGTYNTGVTNSAKYDQSIDHIFGLNTEQITVNTYRTMNDDPIIPLVSDHRPQLIDLTVNQSNN